jgi:hypothetical protein
MWGTADSDSTSKKTIALVMLMTLVLFALLISVITLAVLMQKEKPYAVPYSRRSEPFKPSVIADVIAATTLYNETYAAWRMWDNKYVSYPVEDLIKFLEHDDTDKLEYISETFDCEDFATLLDGKEAEWHARVASDEFHAGTAFGILSIYRGEGINLHALNIFIDDKQTVWLVEPQTDSVYRLEDRNTTGWYLVYMTI